MKALLNRLARWFLDIPALTGHECRALRLLREGDKTDSELYSLMPREMGGRQFDTLTIELASAGYILMSFNGTEYLYTITPKGAAILERYQQGLA